jgi:hypothetical protein
MAAPPPYQIPVYQQRATTDTFAPGYLQDFYGTGTMPFQEWVSLVQTGERTITPGNPDDDANMAILQNQQPGEQSFGDMMKGLAPSIAGYTAGAAYDVFSDPYLEGSFGDKVLRTGASLLPENLPFTDIQLRDPLPQSLVDDSTARGYRLQTPNKITGAIGRIPAGKEYYPELATAATARATGQANVDLFNKLNARQLGVMGEPARLGGRTFQTPEGPIAVNPGLGELVGLGRDALGRPVQTADTSYVYNPADVAAARASVGGTLAADPIQSVPTEARTALSGVGDYFGSGDAVMRAGVTGLASFGTALLTGQDPATAARAAVGGTVGGYVGGFFGPIGSMIGSALGASLTRKRVICNELVRQGLMSREHMMLDYKFTKEHLTPQHVRGYHFWAVPVVRKMREGKSVGFWRHVATHRANEIAHIYGKRDKPDYLGKVYRRIFEPACWLVGAICKQKDWQSLYSTKGI